jgi:hypothetical protein
VASGTVFTPPYAAARAFLEWAVDLWPYVNGKAIVSGLKLAEMDAADMVDVLHYYFEDDLNLVSQEQVAAKSESRSVIYRTLYGTTYKYRVDTSAGSTATASGSQSFDDLVPFDPSNNVTKPYVPPTDFDAEMSKPFGTVLDAPLG